MQPIRGARAEVAGVERRPWRGTTSATSVMPTAPSITIVQATSTVSSAASVRRRARSPSGEVAPVPAAERLARSASALPGSAATSSAENEERDGVDQYASVGAGGGEEHAAEQRAEQSSVRFSAVWKSAFALARLVVVDEVRQAGVDGRAEEAGREARDARERRRSATRWCANGSSAEDRQRARDRTRPSARGARAGRGAGRAAGRSRSAAGSRRSAAR